MLLRTPRRLLSFQNSRHHIQYMIGSLLVASFDRVRCPQSIMKRVNIPRTIWVYGEMFGYKYTLMGDGMEIAQLAYSRNPVNSVIHKIHHHLLGHCACCSSYRLLQYQDTELGNLCADCSEHTMSADIELNFGGYDLCRPEVSKKS
jgi:hypothetical protein